MSSRAVTAQYVPGRVSCSDKRTLAIYIGLPMGRSPESLRDVRGFAIKFYTKEGNFDMVCTKLVQHSVCG